MNSQILAKKLEELNINIEAQDMESDACQILPEISEMSVSTCYKTLMVDQGLMRLSDIVKFKKLIHFILGECDLVPVDDFAAIQSINNPQEMPSCISYKHNIQKFRDHYKFLLNITIASNYYVAFLFRIRVLPPVMYKMQFERKLPQASLGVDREQLPTLLAVDCEQDISKIKAIIGLGFQQIRKQWEWHVPIKITPKTELEEEDSEEDEEDEEDEEIGYIAVL